jgi:ADP-heptose:LPS heptosyltransferase
MGVHYNFGLVYPKIQIMTIRSAHVLICRTDNIGDVALTLPVTGWLKQRFPDIKISILCRAYAADFVRQCSTVDDVIEVENVSPDLEAYFAAANIDTIIFAQPNQQLAIAAFKARIPNRIGNARQKLYQLIFCNRRIRFSKRTSLLHEAQFNFEFLKPFGLERIPALDEIKNLYLFKTPRNTSVTVPFQRHAFNLVIHAKSNGHGREWPVEHYTELARLLSQNDQIHLWLTGSADEGQWLALNAPDLLQLPNITDVCGKFTLGQLTCFIKGADGMIASGTGPLHMAAALGQRTLGLFPPTRPMHPGRWAPLGVRAQFLCMSESCEGCEEKKTLTCDCMRNISPNAVARIVFAWYGEARKENSGQSESMCFPVDGPVSAIPPTSLAKGKC